MSDPIGPSQRTGRSDLGDAEARLRNLFNLEGLVPLDWEGGITPMVVVGDGTLPGMGTVRLRRFKASVQTSNPTGDQWVKATADCIIERVTFIASAVSGTQTIAFLGPSDADPVAIATTFARFTDRSQTSAELAPLLQSGGTGTAGGAVLWGGIAAGLVAQTLFEVWNKPFFLQANAKLRFSSTAAIVNWGLEGMSF